MLGETSLGVVGLVSDLFREVSGETLYTSEVSLRSVRVGWVGGTFFLAIKGGSKAQIVF